MSLIVIAIAAAAAAATAVSGALVVLRKKRANRLVAELGLAAIAERVVPTMEGIPVQVGDVIQVSNGSRWLRHGIGFEERDALRGALFFCEEERVAVAAWPDATGTIGWLKEVQPVEGKAPTRAELGAILYDRQAMFPVEFAKVGDCSGLPNSAVVATYAGPGDAVALFIQVGHSCRVWVGTAFDDSRYDRLGNVERSNFDD